MNPQLLTAQLRDDVPAWAPTVVAFLAENERRSGSRRTVEGYARMFWPFFDRVGSPDRVTPAHVLAWAHGIGASGREPSSATIGARIACLSSCYRFLIRMNITTGNPCDALERPRTVQAVARGLSADEVLATIACAALPDTVVDYARTQQRWRLETPEVAVAGRQRARLLTRLISSRSSTAGGTSATRITWPNGRGSRRPRGPAGRRPDHGLRCLPGARPGTPRRDRRSLPGAP